MAKIEGGWSAHAKADSSAPEPVQGPILLMGDSITFAWAELAGRPNLVNRGVPGQTTTDMLDRFERQLEEAGADGVHILGGVNDIAGNGGSIPLAVTRGNLRTMSIVARRRGLRVWLGSVLPVAGICWAPGVRNASERIVELNLGLKADAQALGVAYLDYHRLMVDDEGRLRAEFGTDGVHLSPAGYAVITGAALAAFAVGGQGPRAPGAKRQWLGGLGMGRR